MENTAALRKAFIRLNVVAACALLVLPIFTLWFSVHAENHWGEEMRAHFLSSIGDLPAAEQQTAKAQIAAISVESICNESGELHDQLCATGSDFWQFHMARKVSLFGIFLGLLTIGLIAFTAFMAYKKRDHITTYFTLGWQGLRALGAVQTILFGAMLTWLSFWLTAYFFNVYVVKLILLVAIMAAVGVFTAVVAIFAKLPEQNAVSGNLIAEADAPALWARIRQMAQSLKTEPPQQLIAGIDTNFFVTQTPMQVIDENRTVQGRSLFVSLPLLGILERSEADAVLAHELAHFSGGDTAESARLGPKLNQFAAYQHKMSEGVLTVMMGTVLNAFRAAFEFALQKRSREREFEADRVAASLTSPADLARSLLKVAGYASYRGQVEQTLFGQQQKHESQLQIADRIQLGLSAFVHTEAFIGEMRESQTPHPFDSHPNLIQRFENVGALIPEANYAAVISAPIQQSWLELIPVAQTLAAAQWQRFEAQFASEHEESLAYRYLPSSPEEAAHVERFFPTLRIALKKGELVLDHTYVYDPATGTPTRWADVEAVQYIDGNFLAADSLVLTHPERNAVGLKRNSTLKLSCKAEQRGEIQQAIGQYWNRYRAAAQNAAPAKNGP
jgi:Zn-dependent protease with chaperone function